MTDPINMKKPAMVCGDEAPAEAGPFALKSDLANALDQYFERDPDGGLWIKIDGVRVEKFPKP